MVKGVKKIGILGAGTMGVALALTITQYDFEVILWDRKNKFTVQRRLHNHHIYKKLDFEMQKKVNNNIKITLNLEDISNVDLVIESIIEDMNAKSRLLKKVSNFCQKSTILSTNTSTLSIEKLSKSTNRTDKFLGIHFFNPPNKIKLVEVIRSEHISKYTLNKVLFFLKEIEKIPILVKDSSGFIVNRLLFPMINEAVNIFEENIASKQDIDKAMVLGVNFPIGPFALADLVGLDVTYSIIQNLHKNLKKDRTVPNKLMKVLLKNKKFGRKSGEGFYLYK